MGALYIQYENIFIYHRGAKLSTVPNCPFFITVPNCPRCQIVRFFIAVPNCPFFITVPNCPRCQIVRGAKLSVFHCGAKLSGCQIVLGSQEPRKPRKPRKP